ncbi:MAG: ATP-binding protein [Pseudomonadota bacterium]
MKENSGQNLHEDFGSAARSGGLRHSTTRTAAMVSGSPTMAPLETYGLTKDVFFSEKNGETLPVDTIRNQGELIWNATEKGMPPLIGFGRRVLSLDSQGKPRQTHVLISFLKTDILSREIAAIPLNQVRIVNGDGDILLQPLVLEIFLKPSLGQRMFFSLVKKSQSRLSISRIENDKGRWLTTFGKTYKNKIMVLSRTPEEKVFGVVKALTYRTLLVGSIVLTLVILAAFLISKSLTENISRLSQRMREVSQGDLSSLIHLRGQDETVELAQSFNQMIEDLKKSRDSLEVMNRELDSKVKERTRELEIQNKKVVETQEALIRTTRLASVGEIAGRAAHEVLNPLTSLLARLRIMSQKLEDKESLSLLNDLRDAWSDDYKSGGFQNLILNWKKVSEINHEENLFEEDIRNISLISQDLSKQKSSFAEDLRFVSEEGQRIGKIVHSMRRMGRLNSEVKSHSVHSLLNDSCATMRDLFHQHQVELDIHWGANLDRVRVDRDEFIQSVTNLMRNSLQSIVGHSKVDHSLQGLLEIRTVNYGEQIAIEIMDNGLGIEDEIQTNLFKKNFTTKNPEEGTGLGLSISRRFIRSYQGDIEFVGSIPRDKTTFRILLPLVSDDESQKKEAA